MEISRDSDKLLNYVIIGNSGVGKSSLLNQFIKREFNYNQSTTVGLEFCASIININGHNIDLHIWDLSGQGAYKNLIRKYCNEADGIILVYDVTNHQSFQDLHNWVNDIHKYIKSNIKILLVGNKTDLDNRIVTNEEGTDFAKNNKILYTETSAKGYISVFNLFVKLTNSIYDCSTTNTEYDNLIYDIPQNIGSCNMGAVNILKGLYNEWYDFILKELE